MNSKVAHVSRNWRTSTALGLVLLVGAVVRVEPEAELMPHERELSNPWAMAKDGKMRFDPTTHKALLRK